MIMIDSCGTVNSTGRRTSPLYVNVIRDIHMTSYIIMQSVGVGVQWIIVCRQGECWTLINHAPFCNLPFKYPLLCSRLIHLEESLRVKKGLCPVYYLLYYTTYTTIDWQSYKTVCVYVSVSLVQPSDFLNKE